MIKKLFLLRHGQAESGFNMKDYNRSLTVEGERAIKTLSEQLASRNFNPENILCSPSKRTTQTCEILTSTIGYKGQVQYEKGIYEATAHQLFELISSAPDNVNTLLLIGHNPGISYLGHYLTGNFRDGMYPGQLVEVSFECDGWKEVSKGSGNLVS